MPWRGYFDFIDDVDLFVFLDDVPYTRRDWRNRNQIKTAQGLQWITVPVLFSQTEQTPIHQVSLDPTQNWRIKHLTAIQRSYSKTPFFNSYWQGFESIIQAEYASIADLDIALSLWLMSQLGINTPTKRSHELSPQGTKTERLIDILKKVGATSYLSGPAAKDYMDNQAFEVAGIKLSFKTYQYDPYPQLYGEFQPAVTVLDLLFNCGPSAKKHLKSLSAHEFV
ncbi:MAG: WbqC family protein [bacterium]|nr:WbqC family protein [bacterium]